MAGTSVSRHDDDDDDDDDDDNDGDDGDDDDDDDDDDDVDDDTDSDDDHNDDDNLFHLVSLNWTACTAVNWIRSQMLLKNTCISVSLRSQIQ